MGKDSNRAFAAKCGLSEGALRSYLHGGTFPPLDTLEKIALIGGVSLAWLASGDGEIKELHSIKGNGFLQARSIDADQVHIYNHTHEPIEEYKPEIDPVDARFIQDWHRLSEVGMMRFWTLLKEELQREKEV